MKTSILLRTAAATIVAAFGVSAHAVPTIDGTADLEYGGALSTQNTNTQFGNAINGDPIKSNGSEIDQLFAVVSGGRLYVTITGNLESNFNKLEVFIDSTAGGINKIDNTANPLPRGVDPFCCGGFAPPDGGNTNNVGALQKMEGLTFDAGFEADHYLTFTHGFETALDPQLTFYAISAHYANLTNGVNGPSGALGMQLAQRGLPNVLRGTTADFEPDGDADGNDFLIWQRNVGATGATRGQGDASVDGTINGADLDVWKAAFGFDVANSTFGSNYYAPQNADFDNSDVLVGPSLPGLSQGQLIDKTYAFGAGGATDNAGTGAVTRELEFALPPIAGTNNAASHRNMENIVDLQMAINNSNTAGVTGDGPYTTPTTGDPQNVMTGLEFSIPLSQIGNPAGPIKIFAFINGGGHDYASNQFSGVGILDANLGGNGFGGFTGDLSGIDMADFAGDQFVTVNVPPITAIPEPSSAALVFALAAALGVAARRR